MSATIHSHDHLPGSQTPAIAALVDGEPVTVAELDARTEQLRHRAFGVRLPNAHTAEGRNARRWVLQLLCAERLLRHEARDRGVVFGAAADARLELGLALSMGGVAAAAVAAGGVAVARDITREVTVAEADVAGYFARNRDRFPGRQFGDVRSQIEDELSTAARARAFAVWLDRQTAERVRLEPGFVHPAEPGHPDATHRH